MATSSKYKFKTYNLNTSEIQKLAFVAQREQGSETGARAELSLMANLFERQSRYSTITNYVLKSGWFASSSTGSSTSDPKWTRLVEDVLIRGNRTLPPQINEHDCINPPDIYYAENNGQSFSPNDRSKYIQGVTLLKNIYGSSYTFWCFPAPGADPFGTTDKNALLAWLSQYGVKGELYFGSDTISDVAEQGSGLVAHVEKLYSSQNYSYIETLKDTSTSFEKNIKKEFSNIIRNVIETRKENKNSKPLVSILKDTVLDFISINNALKTVDNSYDLRIEADISSFPLPVINEPVEAPYFEIEIGGITFGGYKGKKVPNYVKALTVKKLIIVLMSIIYN